MIDGNLFDVDFPCFLELFEYIFDVTNYLRGRHRNEVSIIDVKLAIVEVQFMLDKHNLKFK